MERRQEGICRRWFEVEWTVPIPDAQTRVDGRWMGMSETRGA